MNVGEFIIACLCITGDGLRVVTEGKQLHLWELLLTISDQERA